MDQFYEKIGVLGAKADAAHSRIDKLEFMIRDDLKDIKAELKVVTNNMHFSKGWIAGIIFLAGGTGAGLVKLLSLIAK